MQIKKMYSILDTTTQIFLNPISFLNDGDAIRWFTTVVNNDNKQDNEAMYPHQFILFRLQDFNATNGKYLETMDDKEMLSPKELITGTAVQQEQEKKYSVKELMAYLDNRYGKVTDLDKYKEQVK